MIPAIRLEVQKDGQQIETITLENQAVFKFGRNEGQDFSDAIQLLHESISPMHAALMIDAEKGLLAVDLGSDHGTFINDKRLESHVPAQVRQKGDVLTFGASTRKYFVSVDYSRMLAA